MKENMKGMCSFQTLTIAMAACAVIGTGCAYPNGEPNNTANGALVGAGVGAASGAMLAHNGLAGALVGGAIGAVAGSIIGNQMDQAQAAELRAQAPTTYVRVEQCQPLTTADVKALVQAGVKDDLIITQIQNSHTVYHLSSADIIDLHNAGASDKVIDFMINTVNLPPPAPTVVDASGQPPPPSSETVVAAPGPGYVWVDGDWQWNGVTWVWAGGYWVLPPWPNAVWANGYWYRGPWGGWRHAPGHWR